MGGGKVMHLYIGGLVSPCKLVKKLLISGCGKELPAFFRQWLAATLSVCFDSKKQTELCQALKKVNEKLADDFSLKLNMEKIRRQAQTETRNCTFRQGQGIFLFQICLNDLADFSLMIKNVIEDFEKKITHICNLDFLKLNDEAVMPDQMRADWSALQNKKKTSLPNQNEIKNRGQKKQQINDRLFQLGLSRRAYSFKWRKDKDGSLVYFLTFNKEIFQERGLFELELEEKLETKDLERVYSSVEKAWHLRQVEKQKPN
jgi:hypothetical protein